MKRKLTDSSLRLHVNFLSQSEMRILCVTEDLTKKGLVLSPILDFLYDLWSVFVLT